MSNVSTFGTYALARLGIYAAQSAINITGNNIANVSTNGYSRQFIDQISLNMGGADRYQSKMDTRIGSGAYVLGVTQLRDPYLDIRYRNEQSSVGSYEGWLKGLNQIASVLDEVGRGEDEAGILEARFNELIQQMQNLVTQGAGKEEYDTLVRSAATSIVNTFHSYAQQLQTEFDNQDVYFRQEVDEVNTILERIRNLDATIRKTEIYGGNALELKDSRNVLIDELSKYLKINVTYEKDKVGEGVYVDRLVITTDGIPQRTLVNGLYCTQLSIRQVPKNGYDENGDPIYDVPDDPTSGITYVDSPNYDLDLGPLTDSNGRVLTTKTSVATGDVFDTGATADDNHDAALAALTNKSKYPDSGTDKDGNQYTYQYEIRKSAGDPDAYEIYQIQISNGSAQLTDTELYGKLQSEREILTEVGEYATKEDLDRDSNAGSKRGIPYYQKALDTLANTFANVLNKANIAAATGPNDGEDNTDYALFSNDGTTNNTEGIKASNISISYNWSIHEARIIPSMMYANGEVDSLDKMPSTANDNLQYMLGLLTGDTPYYKTRYNNYDEVGTPGVEKPEDLTFRGSFQEFLTTHMAGTLATDILANQTMLDNHEINSEDLYVERDAVMGVDLNDEAMNLMQYQKAYQAACRLMTVYDEMLNKLINGT